MDEDRRVVVSVVRVVGSEVPLQSWKTDGRPDLSRNFPVERYTRGPKSHGANFYNTSCYCLHKGESTALSKSFRSPQEANSSMKYWGSNECCWVNKIGQSEWHGRRQNPARVADGWSSALACALGKNGSDLSADKTKSDKFGAETKRRQTKTN